MKKEVEKIIEEILSLSNCKNDTEKEIIKLEIGRVFTIGKSEGIKSLNKQK